MYRPKPRPATAIATRKRVEVDRHRDHEQRQAVHDRRARHEGLAAAGAVREPTADHGSNHHDDRLGEGAQEDLLRDLVLGAPQVIEEVVRLVGDQERVGQDEHEAAGEGPREVGVPARRDVVGAQELPQRPRRLVRWGEPTVVQVQREHDDEEPADGAWSQEHRQLVAGEDLHHVGAAHRRDGEADAEDAGNGAPLLDRDLVGQHRHHRGQHRVEEQLRQAPADQHHPDPSGPGRRPGCRRTHPPDRPSSTGAASPTVTWSGHSNARRGGSPPGRPATRSPRPTTGWRRPGRCPPAS